MITKITKKWIIEGGIGHWEVSNGRFTISCDDGEINEAIKELQEDSEAA